MAKNLDKEGLRSIVENYDIFYIDLWGVVHNGITLHKEAVKTLEQITKSKKKIRAFDQCTKTEQDSKFISRKDGYE